MTNRILHPADDRWLGDRSLHSWDKGTARRVLLSARDRIPGALRRQKSEAIRKNVVSFLGDKSWGPRTEGGGVLLSLFLSFGSEIETGPLLPVLFESGHRILLPSVSPSGALILLPWHPEISLRSGSFGILEPDAGDPVNPAEVDCFLVPGVGFDPAGRRLGYGKGYFDRLLSGEGVAGVRVGLCFSEQVVPRIPATDRDVRMNALLTEKGWYPCG